MATVELGQNIKNILLGFVHSPFFLPQKPKSLLELNVLPALQKMNERIDRSIGWNRVYLKGDKAIWEWDIHEVYDPKFRGEWICHRLGFRLSKDGEVEILSERIGLIEQVPVQYLVMVLPRISVGYIDQSETRAVGIREKVARS